jgi:predicted TIM-barrel fold metal-dependent hydrolase
MIIDAHAHLVPQSWFNPHSPPAIFDIEALLQAQDEAQVDMTLFGNNWIRTPSDRTPFDVVVEFNEFAAETTQNHPDRLQGLACTVPFGDDRFLKEAERAVVEFGLKGIMVNSSVDGEYLDSPNAVPFFELVSALDVPLFIPRGSPLVQKKWRSSVCRK